MKRQKGIYLIELMIVFAIIGIISAIIIPEWMNSDCRKKYKMSNVRYDHHVGGCVYTK